MYNRTFLSASILCALTVTAQAQESTIFDDILVSATRVNSQVIDTAASVTVITDSDIEQNMATDLESLFQYTPGVTLTKNPRQGVQGINIRGIEGNRIKVIVDGVAQPSQFDSGGTFLNSSGIDIDTDMIKSVEVVKGAASSLQGSDAIGGIVAFETKDPADILQGREFAGYAKLNYHSATKTFSESVALANKTGNVESLLAFTRRDGKEVNNFGDTDKEKNQSNSLLFKLHYQANPNHRLQFTANLLHNKNDIDTLEYNNFKDGSGVDKTEQYQIGFKHIWEADLAFADRVTWQLDWMSKEETGITERTSTRNGNKQKKDYLYSDKGLQFDGQFDKVFDLANTEHYLVYGISFSNKDIKNTNEEYNTVGSDQTLYYMPNASETRYGLFVQDEIGFGNFIITPGLRFDHFETSPGDTSANPSGNPASEYKDYSDSALTARLGSIYKLNDNHRIFAQVSQGFRAPDFQELYYSFGNPRHGYINKPNPNLKSEESISYELGWRYNSEQVKNEISLFYSDFDNFIDRQIVSGSIRTRDAVFQSINIDKATIKGVEFSNQLSWNGFMPIDGFSSHIAAAYTEGEDAQSNPLNSVSPWNTVFGVRYDSIDNWGAAVNLNYTAKKKSRDISGETPPIGAATVVDLTAYYQPIRDLTLRAGIFNATNEEYYDWNTARSLTSEDKSKTQPKRHFAITAKYEF